MFIRKHNFTATYMCPVCMLHTHHLTWLYYFASTNLMTLDSTTVPSGNHTPHSFQGVKNAWAYFVLLWLTIYTCRRHAHTHNNNTCAYLYTCSFLHKSKGLMTIEAKLHIIMYNYVQQGNLCLHTTIHYFWECVYLQEVPSEEAWDSTCGSLCHSRHRTTTDPGNTKKHHHQGSYN